MKYRLKKFRPEYFSDYRYIPQYKYSWWPWWCDGPSVRTESEALLIIDTWKTKANKPTYYEVD